MTTAALLISAVTNIAITAQLLETRRRLRNAQRMFKMYADHDLAIRISRNLAPWEVR